MCRISARPHSEQGGTVLILQVTHVNKLICINLASANQGYWSVQSFPVLCLSKTPLLFLFRSINYKIIVLPPLLPGTLWQAASGHLLLAQSSSRLFTYPVAAFPWGWVTESQLCSCGCPSSPPGLSGPSLSLAAFPPILCFRLTDVSDFAVKTAFAFLFSFFLLLLSDFSRGWEGSGHLYTAILKGNLSVNTEHIFKCRQTQSSRKRPESVNTFLRDKQAELNLCSHGWQTRGKAPLIGTHATGAARSTSSCVEIKCSCLGV